MTMIPGLGNWKRKAWTVFLELQFKLESGRLVLPVYLNRNSSAEFQYHRISEQKHIMKHPIVGRLLE
jgi:hypothetical protein